MTPAFMVGVVRIGDVKVNPGPGVNPWASAFPSIPAMRKRRTRQRAAKPDLTMRAAPLTIILDFCIWYRYEFIGSGSVRRYLVKYLVVGVFAFLPAVALAQTAEPLSPALAAQQLVS